MGFSKKIAIILAVISITGCVSNIESKGNQRLSDVTSQQLNEKFAIGKSTKGDVLRFLGRPDFPVDYKNIDVWIYHYERLDRQIILFLPVRNDQNKNLLFKFGEDGILSEMNFVSK